jgi:hypothetical protein
MAKKQIIQPALGLEDLKKQAAKIKFGENSAQVQQDFITPHSLNSIFTSEGDPFLHGVQAYFMRIRNLTENYMASINDPKKLSLKGQQSLRGSCNI